MTLFSFRRRKRRRQPRDNSWCIVDPAELDILTDEEKIRTAAEDAEIKRRQEAYPLH